MKNLIVIDASDNVIDENNKVTIYNNDCVFLHFTTKPIVAPIVVLPDGKSFYICQEDIDMLNQFNSLEYICSNCEYDGRRYFEYPCRECCNCCETKVDHFINKEPEDN